MIKKISLIIFAILVFSFIYFRLLIFSADLNENTIEKDIHAFYKDNYLNQVGFVTKIDSFETWYCLGKLDTFKWIINEKTFKNKFTLCLNTAKEINPYYFSISIRMDEKIDSTFRIEMGFKKPDSVLEMPSLTITKSELSFFKLKNGTYLKRYFLKRDSVPGYVEYSIVKENFMPNQLSIIDDLKIKIVKFLYNLV